MAGRRYGASPHNLWHRSWRNCHESTSVVVRGGCGFDGCRCARAGPPWWWRRWHDERTGRNEHGHLVRQTACPFVYVASVVRFASESYDERITRNSCLEPQCVSAFGQRQGGE